MSGLGCTYNENKKCYYTESHERQDVVEDRNTRLLVHYFRLEKCAYRWVQLGEEDTVKMEITIDNFPKDCYYSYLNENNNKMHEYHVDTHHKLCDFESYLTAQFGGNVSVRVNGR